MKAFIYLILFGVLCSCSLLNKVALNSTAELILGGSDESLTESDWQHFKEAAPGNLKLVEGLWFNDQRNSKLLITLIKGYGAYSFAVLETQAFEALLLGESSKEIERAIIGYEKAINYGFKLLELRGITKKSFFNKNFLEKLDFEFNSKLKKDDLVGIFYLAQAMGSSMNLQRTNIDKMSTLNHIRALARWVCAKEPTIERNSCSLFMAIMESSTPTLLGGKPELGKQKFLKIFEEESLNLLAKISFIQLSLIPLLEEDEFYTEMQKLKKELDLWYTYVLGSRTKRNQKYQHARFLNLYNAIAKKRYDTLWALRKELF
jgi:hypothetical protein